MENEDLHKYVNAITDFLAQKDLTISDLCLVLDGVKIQQLDALILTNGIKLNRAKKFLNDANKAVIEILEKSDKERKRYKDGQKM